MAYLDIMHSIIQTYDGGYIVLGCTGNTSLQKVDKYGNWTWKKILKNGCGRSIQQVSDGYIVAGDNTSNVWIAKADKDGNELWNKTLMPGQINSINVTSDGGYILAGTRYKTMYDGNALILKTDKNGKEQWNRKFGRSNWDDAHYGQQTSDGGYVLIGETSSYGAGNRDVWLIEMYG